MPSKYTDEINGIIKRTKEIQILRNLTVSEWFSIFLSDYCQNIKLSTLASYQQAVTNHINVILGDILLDIDFQGGTITISRQLTRDKITHQYVLTSVKNNKPRSISPAPFVLKRLQREYGGNRNDFVFTNEFGKHFSHNAVYRYLKKVADKAFGRSDVRFHDLRHTYAVLSLQAGDDYKTLQANMGHYSAAFTLDRYGHCTDTMKKVSSQRMESYYKDVLMCDTTELQEPLKIII